MTTTRALPTTIDGVIERLEEIIRDSIARHDRLGYFAALYNRVTLAVREGIQKGEFEDGARMERLDVVFANRYLAAYDHFRAGDVPTRSWLTAFRAASSTEHVVLQHLLAGMNAHINLDLGIAAARTCPGAELPGLKGDFDRINAVLAKLTPTVEQEIDDLSPVFHVLTSFAPKLELKMVGFSMDRARAEAWRLAQELAPLSVHDQVHHIAERDLAVTLVAGVVLNDGLIVRAIRSRESTDVARNVTELCGGGFRVAIQPTIPLPAK